MVLDARTLRLSTSVSRCVARLSSPRRLHTETLAQWIDSPKEANYKDTLHTERLADLFATLSTRDGTRKPYEVPRAGEPLPYGHHLTFFYPRSAEPNLRPDGTDGSFCPPAPFIRRMWAGGSMSWDNTHPLRVGQSVNAVATVDEEGVQLKNAGIKSAGAEEDLKEHNNKTLHLNKSSMVFVNQHIAYTAEGRRAPSLVERRSHVFLPGAVPRGGAPKPVDNLPNPQFSLEYMPTATTLFRFSALTFNAHRIHLDKEYAHEEGYSERLVHGPLTALMFYGDHGVQLSLRTPSLL
ncbi:uncharacterized protein SCHCODRAFT_02605106 [Schizophyllum commune H4-8]|nr:uncharacterized protein SCHCODRAFT_02605106 [Schizophyllum commune H4-8]KAI5899428.1 hypothetical protein SCHCODRAFT_02605106 [Schizophyllum commune H4-8]